MYQGRKGLTVETVETPSCGSGEVLIEVRACGVCGTDVHLSEGHIPISLPKVIPGHEISGVVKQVGAGVSTVSAGDAVIIFPQIFCGECYACKAGSEELCVKPLIYGMNVHGGFAEFISVPERVVMKAPAQLDFSERALFAESVGVAYHALFARGEVKPKERVLIVGVGGLGTNAIKLLKGVPEVEVIAMDTSQEALDRATKLGAHAVDPTKQDPKAIIGELTGGAGVDLAVEFVGRAETVKSAFRLLKKGGRLVLVGVGQERPDFGPIIAMASSGKSIIPSFGYSKKSAQELLKYVSDQKISFSDSISKVFSLEEAPEAVEQLKISSGSAVRFIVQPTRS